MPRVQRQLRIEHRAPHAEALQEEAQPEAGVDAVHEEQTLFAEQTQFEQRHRDQEPVVPALNRCFVGIALYFPGYQLVAQ